MVIIVDKALGALATVSGKPFYSNELVWDNGPIYPYRIPIKFLHVLKKDQRPPILGDVREVLTSIWGPKYGWGIMNQSVIEGLPAEALVKTITSRPNDLAEIEVQLPLVLEQTKQEEQKPKSPISQQEETSEMPLSKELTQSINESESGQEQSLHSQAENALIRLGRATGCSVCIASNDKNRLFQGNPLGKDCLPALPSFGLNEEATRTIKLIDVIWTIRNSPVCAFEVETTTSIYSGLLRMSDLLSVVPSLNIKLYIVAPKEREDKVRLEINRPTFQKIGLNEYCKFIPLEELSKLLTRVEGLQGYIQPTIIDTIAKGFEQEKHSM